MNKEKGYVYLGSSDDLNDNTITKIGVCKNLKDRLHSYKTSLPYYGFKPYLIIVCENRKIAEEIERYLQIELIEESLYHLNNGEYDDEYDGGMEWFQNIYSYQEIYDLLENTDYNYEILEGSDLEEFIEKEKGIIRKNRDRYFNKIMKLKRKIKKKYNFEEREYQVEAIDYCSQQLNEHQTIYLELATGAGKTYIVFKILAEFNPNFIVMFSPRLNINSQNISQKYLQLLKGNYEVLNLSDNTSKNKISKFFNSNKKRIVVACSQSSKKLYNLIKKYDVDNIFTWFDEAHWSFGEWLNDSEDLKKKYQEEEHRRFWLENNENIDYRFFVSASPNPKIIKSNPNIYGEHYKPITVKELIDQNWLCRIDAYQFAYPKDKDDVNLVNYIITEFQAQKREWGFSFHSKQLNAFNMFYQHFKKLKNNKTDIKPFLLIGSDFYNIFKDDFNFDKYFKDIENKNNKLSKLFEYDDEETIKMKKDELEKLIKELRSKYLEIEKYYKETNVKYNYKDIEDFEHNQNSVGYIVQKYNMGYDFSKIDFIIITDSKSSYKDIIQSIGRGLRSDKEGEKGRNKDKVLKVHLPVYFEESNNLYKKFSYEQVQNVLVYLLNECDVNFEDMIINFKKHFKCGFNKGYENNGIEEMKSQIIDLLKKAKIIKKKNLKQLIQFCIKHKIHNNKEYIRFKANYPCFEFKDNVYKYSGFYWQKVVDPKCKIYYNKKEKCLKSKKLIIKNLQETLSDVDYEDAIKEIEYNGWVELHNYDAKIPPYCDLDKFYP